MAFATWHASRAYAAMHPEMPNIESVSFTYGYYTWGFLHLVGLVLGIVPCSILCLAVYLFKTRTKHES